MRMRASASSSPPAPVERHFGLDWLRIAAFGLLIPYHIGMYFAPGHWVVKSLDPVAWVSWPLALMRPWRLSLLFLVSGYATCALLGKLGGPRAFVRSRSLRLLVPLAFGTLFIVAPQGWVRLAETGYAGSFLHYFLVDRFRGGLALPSTEHLWFLLYLWAYSMALVAALVLLPERWQARAREGVEMLGTGARLLLVPLALMALARLSIVFVIPEGGNLLTDWHNHFAYVPPFLFGFALAATPALWRPVARLWRPALAISLACAIVLLWAEATYPNGEMPGHLAEMLILSASAAMGWAMLLVLLAAAHRWLRRDHRLRPIAAEAVFPFYLIHQTIIVVLGWELHPLALGAGIEFAIILAATVAGCAAFYLVGREIAWLRPLIGLSGPPPPPADRHPLPAAAAAP